MKRLSGKVVVLSGGTRGMGEAQVRAMHAEGAQIIFGGRDENAGRTIERDLGGDAVFCPLDVTSTADWDRIVGMARARFGRLDGLMNNAGYGVSHALEDVTDEEWDRVIAVNQTGVFFGMRAALGLMIESGGGSIVNVASPAGVRGHSHVVPYSAAKAAVVGMSRSAARELAPRQIRVNVFIPGFFDTRLLDESSHGRGVERGAKLTPLGRVAQPEESAGPVIFLLSDESSFVTGTELTADGGYTA